MTKLTGLYEIHWGKGTEDETLVLAVQEDGKADVWTLDDLGRPWPGPDDVNLPNLLAQANPRHEAITNFYKAR
jgi:hypothetical protein